MLISLGGNAYHIRRKWLLLKEKMGITTGENDYYYSRNTNYYLPTECLVCAKGQI